MENYKINIGDGGFGLGWQSIPLLKVLVFFNSEGHRYPLHLIDRSDLMIYNCIRMGAIRNKLIGAMLGKL